MAPPELTPLEDPGYLRTTEDHGPKFTVKTKPTQSQLYKLLGTVGQLQAEIALQDPHVKRSFEVQIFLIPRSLFCHSTLSGCQHQPQQLMRKKKRGRERREKFSVSCLKSINIVLLIQKGNVLSGNSKCTEVNPRDGLGDGI